MILLFRFLAAANIISGPDGAIFWALDILGQQFNAPWVRALT